MTTPTKPAAPPSAGFFSFSLSDDMLQTLFVGFYFGALLFVVIGFGAFR